MSTRSRIAAAVVAAVAGGALVVDAIRDAATSEGVTVDAATLEAQAAVIDAAVALRQMGHRRSGLVQDIATTTGIAEGDVAPVVTTAVGSTGRDDRSLRTERVAWIFNEAVAAAVGQAEADALCEPLLLDGQATALSQECQARQSHDVGAVFCSGGVAAGRVSRTYATTTQAALYTAHVVAAGAEMIDYDGVDAAVASRGWGECPEEQ